MWPVIAVGAVLALQAPTVVTGPATDVTRTGATLHGTVDAHGASDANDIWDYGPTRAYGSQGGGFNGFSGAKRSVTLTVSGLAPGTIYHYRITATSSGGKAFGKDRTFKTLGAPVASLTPVSGTVLVKTPGSSSFTPLATGRQIRMGSIVDTTRGTVKICPPNGQPAASRCASFHDGVFKLRQAAGAVIELRLVAGDFSVCKGRHAAAARLAATSVRHLWGDGHGRFRTVGRYSSATIRGTTWLVDDRCDGTLTRVTKGSVLVRDFVRKRSIIVRAGHRYLARGR